MKIDPIVIILILLALSVVLAVIVEVIHNKKAKNFFSTVELYINGALKEYLRVQNTYGKSNKDIADELLDYTKTKLVPDIIDEKKYSLIKPVIYKFVLKELNKLASEKKGHN